LRVSGLARHRSTSLIACFTAKIRGQTIDLSVKTFQQIPELIHSDTEDIVSAGAIENDAHSVAREVGYASRTSDDAESLESYVLFFGQANTDCA
jgi:hypothetical protein